MRIIFFALLFFLLSAGKSFASWYYPMDKYFERQTVKGFGQSINDDFYKGKESLFPYNRFYGYHAAVDLEVYPDEKSNDTPVYAINSGTVSYIGSLAGYGGVILLQLDGTNDTALYGHVRSSGLPIKVGEHIDTATPKVLAYLGNEFSSQTSKERKHLHFGIYRGQDNYFHGHESSLGILNKRWYDPNEYLKSHNAKFPTDSPTIVEESKKITSAVPAITKTGTKKNLLKVFFDWLLDLFQK